MQDDNEASITLVCRAYLTMASQLGYRPDFEGDGLDMDPPFAAKLGLFDKEAVAYAQEFLSEEHTGNFSIGVANLVTIRALVYAIEAARNLCGAEDERAEQLLQLALDELAKMKSARPVNLPPK